MNSTFSVQIYRMLNPDIYAVEKIIAAKQREEYRLNNREEYNAYQVNYRKPKLKILAENARNNYQPKQRKNRYLNDSHRLLHNMKVHNRKEMSIVIWHYSNGTYSCACCGMIFSKDFLEVDHPFGGGCKHRRDIGRTSFYHWLIVNNLPSGFKILCGNCNRGKWRNNGVCPHKDLSNTELVYLPPKNPNMIPHRNRNDRENICNV